MVLFYCECGLKARSATRLYRERLPAGPHPSYSTILSVVKRLMETGCVTSRPRSGRPAKVGWQVQPGELLPYAVQGRSVNTVPLKNSGLDNSTGIRRLSIATNASACFTRRGCRATLFRVQLRHESDAGLANILGRCSVDRRGILFTKWNVQ